MPDYGPFDEYMSAKNSKKCFELVRLVTAAHNAFDSDVDELINGPGWGDYIAAGFTFREIVKHLKTCERCKDHPLLKNK